MERRLLIVAIIITATIPSCVKESIPPISKSGSQKLIINAESHDFDNTGTKVWLKGTDLSLNWSGNDALGVYDGVCADAGGIKFPLTAGANTPNGTFSGSINESASGAINLLYPYQTYVASLGSTDYTTSFNAETNKFFPVMMPYELSLNDWEIPIKTTLTGRMSSAESVDPVQMRTVAGFIKIRLKSSASHAFTRMEIIGNNGEPLGGTVSVDVSGDTPSMIFQSKPYLNSTKQKVAYDIFVTPKSEATFRDAYYVIPMPPGEYTKGITIKFIDHEGKVSLKSGTAPLSINRAVIKNLGIINAEELEWNEALDLRFLTATTSSAWPFEESLSGNNSINKEHSFTYDGHTFGIKGVSEIGCYGLSGLNIKGAGSYISLPAIPGKKLVKVFLRGGGMTDRLGNSNLKTSDGSQDLLLSGVFQAGADNTQKASWWGNKEFGEYKIWSGFESLENTSYRLQTSDGSALRVINLTAFYEDTTPQEKNVSAVPTAMLYGDESRTELPYAKDPTVIRKGDYYYMYYSVKEYEESKNPGNLMSGQAGWHSAIARSTDLINWTRLGDVDLRDSYGYVIWNAVAPCVKILDGVIHMFYQRPWAAAGGNNVIWHAVSNDGIMFKNVYDQPVFIPNNSWSINRAIDAEVYKVGDKLVLMYATRDASTGTVQMLGMAEAPYGSDYGASQWTSISTDAFLTPTQDWEGHCIEAPTVLEKDGIWYLFYAGSYNHIKQQIGLATSTDGYNFTRVNYIENNPGLFYKTGTVGSWNAAESGHPGVFEDTDGSVYLFFQGKASQAAPDNNYLLSMLILSFE